jgi:hypothetical protein
MQSTKKTSNKSSFFWLGQLFILSAIVFLTTTAFKYAGDSPLSASKIGNLTEDVRKNEVLAWQLHHNVDHHGTGGMIKADPENPQFLILASNNTFIAFDVNEKREGRWEADYETNQITFYCQEINGEKISGEPSAYVFKVKDYQNKALKLTWQGKEGSIDMIYNPINKTNLRGSISLTNL